jgi:FAD/FMN-containing dehydrogenase
MKRRQFLKNSSLLVAGSLLPNLFLENALGQAVPIDDLQRVIGDKDGVILTPKNSDFTKYQPAYNLRTLLTPSVRVLCKTAQAVSESLLWAQKNSIPFAIRCGGHSYEGLSQSKGLVIDLRLMNDIQLSTDKKTIAVGGGTKLGEIYAKLAPQKVLIPAGTCPTVGVSGHTTGGGYGMLARAYGLACDSLIEVEIVTADGQILIANENQNTDLLWACRGGGGGSFGVITKLTFKTHPVDQAVVFGFQWTTDQAHAVQLIQNWLQWAPNLPNEITSLMSIAKGTDGKITIRYKGQSIGAMDQLKKEIAKLPDAKTMTNVVMKSLSYVDAIKYFAGAGEDQPHYRKVKCNYLTDVTSKEGLNTLLSQFPVGKLSITLDCYSGAISERTSQDAAFAHRAGTLCSIKFSSNWSTAGDTDARLKVIRNFHDSLKPYMSTGSYVNYCDTDIQNYGETYWGDNFARLKSIKSKYDPKNIFRHAQSIPVE